MQGVFIAVIGSGECSPEEERMAEEVGRELARRGAVLVCGGLGGVMEAACRGAAGAGGLTVGILPGSSRREANPYVRIPIVTGMGYARNAIVARSAQAVIAIAGAYGTLSEIAFALQSNIPVIGLNTWSIARDGQEDRRILKAMSHLEAVEKALEMARDTDRGGPHVHDSKGQG
jgi:hypothetical protein